MTGTGTPGPDPVGPEEIDAGWLGRALEAGGALDRAARVTGAAGNPVGTGQVASTWRFELAVEPGDHGQDQDPLTSVVVKTASSDPTSRAAGMALGLYEKEVGFYRHLAARVGIRTPRCYYATLDAPSGRFALVLEDLSPSAPVDQLTGLTPAQVGLALDELAALHAPMWGDPSIEEVEWLGKGRIDPATAAAMLPLLYDQFVERYRDDLDPGVVETVTRLRGAVGGAEPPRPYTVVHSDFRADNLVFEGGGGRVPIATVDWQTVTYGVAATDLAFVVGTSLGRDERREHEEALVQRYQRALLDAGVDYDAERCWDDYRRWASYGVMFLVPSTVLVERTERGDAMFLTAITRAHEQMADLGTLALLGV
jgi:hypothetical protein